jgi:hypothetical protein
LRPEQRVEQRIRGRALRRPIAAIAAITLKAMSSPPNTYVTLRSGSVSLRSVVVISTPASGQSRLGMLTIFDNIDIR